MTAMATMAFSTIAAATDNAPQFAVTNTSTNTIAAGAGAFKRGHFSRSESYSRHALKSGLNKSRTAVAYSNLCAALGAQGKYDEALKACDNATDMSSKKWQAYSNRAAVNLLKGEKELAAQDLQIASSLSGKKKSVVYNLALLD